MYEDSYSETILKKLVKLKKKDPLHLQKVLTKIDSILEKPNASYKYLRHNLKGFQRVHIGHFVLVFVINHENKIISFEDYDHHDKIYQ